MSVPMYFVQPPDAPSMPGLCALCGWYAGEDGGLIAPQTVSAADALVFDDRNPLPPHPEALAADLSTAAKQQSAQLLILDFERPPSPAACRLTALLAAVCRVVAPLPFCGDSTAEPLVCYRPELETFDAFSRRISNLRPWLELCPVEQSLSYPISDALPDALSPDQFSETLQCHYQAEQRGDTLTLRLFDTPQSLAQRLCLLRGCLRAVIGLRQELEAFTLSEAIE